MPDIMVKNEYRNVMFRIGAAMLIHTLLINLLYGAWVYFPIEGLSEKSYFVFCSLFDSFSYLFSFLFPAWFFYKISYKKNIVPPWCEVRITGSYPLMLFAGLGVILLFQYVNYYAVELFEYSKIYEPVDNLGIFNENYKLILSIISIAIVPAFCEEFLFRGVIISNLSPYGNKSAIIISAILFGFMHQNIGQIIYTTVAGVILGYIYIRTRSIWGCVMLHFINNLYSVITSLLQSRLDQVTASNVLFLTDIIIIGIGLLALVAFIIVEVVRKKKSKSSLRFSNGSFGEILEPIDSYSEYNISVWEKIKSFFVPTVTIFVTISCLYMGYLCYIAIQL